MKKLISGIILLFIIGVFGEAAYSANPLPGSQFTVIGQGAKEASLAYAGIADLGGIEGALLNPAKMATQRRGAFSLSLGGLGSDYTLGNLGVAVPSLAGVFTFNALYQNGPSSTTALGSLVGLNVGISKPITDSLYWGFALRFAYGAGLSPFAYDWQAGFDMGFIKIYRSAKKYGVGFYDFSYGASLRNIGKTAKLDTYDPLAPMGLGVGTSFTLMRFKMYEMKWLADVYVPFDPVNFTASLGMENTLFNILKIRGGVNYNDMGISYWSAGAALAFSFQAVAENPDTKTDVEIAYALQSPTFTGNNLLNHSVSLNIAMGYYDTKKPKVKISSDSGYFSPNYDGSRDEVQLALSVEDNQMVNRWEVEIRDSENKVVKTFKSSDKLQVRNLTIQKFFKQIFSKKKAIYVPPYVTWEGKDNNGNPVPDGKYTYVLKGWDENDNLAQTGGGALTIDTEVPKIGLSSQDILFSPNDDGLKDDLTINVNSENFRDSDLFSAYISDPDGNVIREFDYTNSTPEKLVWDGKDRNGNPVKEGVYSIRGVAQDRAGNKTEATVAQIRLVTNYQTVKLGIPDNAFSPNSDGENDVLSITPTISDTAGLLKWTLKFIDTNANTVHVMSGENQIPPRITWNGKNDAGEALPDGTYLCQLGLEFDSGNAPRSEWIKVKIDTQPTKMDVKAAYLEFSPNRDGIKDDITFTNNLSGDPDDTVVVKLIQEETKNLIYYDKNRLADTPPAFTWDGYDRRTQPPYRNFPQGYYVYSVETVDKVGNKNLQQTRFYIKTGRDQAGVKSDVVAISPGSSSANASVTFRPELTSTKMIENLTLEIRNSDNKVVRKFDSKEYTPEIKWDGKDDSGKELPDGLYTYDMKVKYSYGDEPQSDTRTILIDRVAPELKLQADDTVFSPNNDGRKETLSIALGVKGDPNDIFVGTFVSVKDAEGKPVRTYRWKGNEVPEKVQWDGRDDKGRLVPEGVYTFELVGEDSAKNTTRKEIKDIRLARAFENMMFETLSDTRFSPTPDGKQKTISFQTRPTNMSQFSKLENAELVILDFQGKPVKTIRKGENDRLDWDGTVDGGDIAPDGIYTAEMRYQFDSGNLITRKATGIILDKTPPVIRLSVQPELFTPDGDKVNDMLVINLEIFDPSKMEWRMSIYKKVPGWQNTRPFKSFYAGDPSEQVKQSLEWDGYGDLKLPVESVQDYVLVVEAEDSLGNKSRAERDIVVGVLLIERAYDWIIRVNSINFETGKYTLAPDGKVVVQKVADIIEKVVQDPAKYRLSENYSIQVAGHTDIVGPEEVNKPLSAARARTVQDYLKEQLKKKKVKVDLDRLTSQGYWFSQQLTRVEGETDTEYNARNRRVEFIIKK